MQLYEALLINDVDKVKTLIDHGADPNTTVEHPIFGSSKSIDVFRNTLENRFNPKWNEINDYLMKSNF